MIPDILAKLLRQLANDFTPDQPRKEYLDHKDIWELYLSLYELDGTKLDVLIDKHDNEDDGKYQLRQKLAAVFNYVPSIMRMVVNYIFTEQPEFAVENEAINQFLANCDGRGTPYPLFVKRSILPLAMLFGFVDVLIQNPATPEGIFVTGADDAAAPPETNPVLFNVTPLQRINWSCREDGDYNWVRIRDDEGETADPFVQQVAITQRYLTITGHVTMSDGAQINDEQGREVGFWISSRQELEDNKTVWVHDGGWLPMSYVPISTLYYLSSLDPHRRHFGLSKIAMIAVLTKKIIQVLSWTDEDILANLAVFVFPGTQPVDKQGNPIATKIAPWSVIWLGNNVQINPEILQGETSHIEIKMKLIDAYVQEILRIAYLLGVNSDGTQQVTSGVQAIVARNELFMELGDLAGSLDSFTYDVFSKFMAWKLGTDYSISQLLTDIQPRVNFFKGPYAVDPLAVVIANSQSLIDIFSRVSPTMVKSVMRQLAQAALYNEDQNREIVFAEIDRNFDAQVSEENARAAALEAAVQQAGLVQTPESQ
jgi:hypothetical protein